MVTNQGIITGNNFTTLVTNDPLTPAPDDPTITLLNMFPLPVHLVEVRASFSGLAVKITWEVKGEENMKKYEVERSLDGSSFMKIGEINARNNPAPSLYEHIDNNPGIAASYYRLRIISNAGSVKYSPVVRVERNGNYSVNVYPNPVTGNTFTMQLNNFPAGRYELLLYNSSGQVIFRQQIIHVPGSQSVSVTPAHNMKTGMYVIQLKGEKNSYIEKLVVK